MRWSYEEVIVAQAKLNPLTRRQDRVDEEIKRVAALPQTPETSRRLDDLKETLAMLSGLEAKSPAKLDDYLAIIDRILAGKEVFNRNVFADASGAGHRRSALRESKGFGSGFECRDGANGLSAGRKAECLFWQTETVIFGFHFSVVLFVVDHRSF